MRRRHKIKKGKSKRMFTQGAKKMHVKNAPKLIMRGGTRL